MSKRSLVNSTVTRRTFLQTSAAAAGAVALPYFVPASAFGANERVVTGHIGVGGQGLSDMKAFLSNAAAVCDVDKVRATKALVEVEKSGRKCESFGDYRKLLDRKDLDAVVVATPDHWHALLVIHACQAGKDVYCEKPLSLTIVEGRKMVEAARANKRIVQTGSQQRSDERFRRACELVRSGHIGKLQRVLVGIPDPNHPGEPIPDSEPPAEFDYEMWLGPAPYRPYNKNRVHYNFRFFWDYSGGQMTNFGAHDIDIAHWGMGRDGSGPTTIEGTATFHPKKWHEVTETCHITYTYDDGVKLIVAQGNKEIPKGATFIGSKGQLHVTRSKLTSKPAQIAATPAAESDVKLYASKNHHQNFLECIKSRELPICDVEIGHRTATACHLGNLAVRLGRKLTWDPVKEAILGDDEASGMLQRPYRSPWMLG